MDGYDFDDYEFRRLVNAEAERLAEERSRSLIYKAERIGTRMGRIAIGLALAAGGFATIDNIKSISDTPFASLTMGMLAGNIAGWVFGLGLIWWAFAVAFGAGPTKHDLEKSFSSRAEDTVKERRRLERMNT